MAQITFCPPVLENHNVHFDTSQFAARRQYAVEAHYVGAQNGLNGWVGSGIDFLSFGRMQTMKRGHGRASRRLPVPEFMQSEKRFRAVILRYLEIKAGDVHRQQRGSELERMRRVSERLKKKAEKTAITLDAFCARFMAATDPAERKRVQQIVSEYDTAIRILREPWVIPAMCRAYYFEGLDSKAVGERFCLKADHARQIFRRLTLLDAALQKKNALPAKNSALR